MKRPRPFTSRLTYHYSHVHHTYSPLTHSPHHFTSHTIFHLITTVRTSVVVHSTSRCWIASTNTPGRGRTRPTAQMACSSPLYSRGMSCLRISRTAQRSRAQTSRGAGRKQNSGRGWRQHTLPGSTPHACPAPTFLLCRMPLCPTSKQGRGAGQPLTASSPICHRRPCSSAPPGPLPRRTTCRTATGRGSCPQKPRRVGSRETPRRRPPSGTRRSAPAPCRASRSGWATAGAAARATARKGGGGGGRAWGSAYI